MRRVFVEILNPISAATAACTFNDGDDVKSKSKIEIKSKSWSFRLRSSICLFIV